MNRTASRKAPAQAPAGTDAGKEATSPACKTNLFCPVCGKEFLPDEIGKKPHCRRCGYLESCCNPQ